MLTTDEVLKRTGISNIKTLTRWHQRGLIPAPELQTHPDGRGMTGYWPEGVVLRCRQIQWLVSRGHGLDSIGEMLGRSGRRYFFRDVSRIMDDDVRRQRLVELISEHVEALATDFDVNIRKIWKVIDAHLLRQRTLDQIISLYRDGQEPVLVLSGQLVNVVASADVPDQLDRHDGASIVVSLSGAVESAYPDLGTV